MPACLSGGHATPPLSSVLGIVIPSPPCCVTTPSLSGFPEFTGGNVGKGWSSRRKERLSRSGTLPRRPQVPPLLGPGGLSVLGGFP